MRKTLTTLALILACAFALLAQQHTLPFPWPTGTLAKISGGVFTNAGSGIVTGKFSVGDTVQSACTITGWDITIPKGETGTATVKFTRVASGTASPGSGDEINTSGVSLASGTHVHSTTVTDFTSTSLAAYDVVGATVTALTGTVTVLSAVLECSIPTN